MAKILLLFSFLLLSIGAQAQINLYVNRGVAVSGAGTSWATAFKTLNEALNVANAGSPTTKYDIHITGGYYYPTGVQGGANRDSTFQIAHGGIRLFGGYSFNGAIRSTTNYRTYLSGGIGVPSLQIDNSYHIMVIAGIATSTDSIILDGLNFWEGYANGTGSKTFNGVQVSREQAAAVMIKDVACPVQINDCDIYWHYASGAAAGIYNENAATRFTRCDFDYNITVGNGGALYINSTSNTAPVVLSDCSFIRNASFSGGAIYNVRNGGAGAGTMISNCQFGWQIYPTARNTATGKGGAIFDTSTNCAASSINGCVFYHNTAANGGAIATDNKSVSAGGNYLSKCVFFANQATQSGGAVSNIAAGFNFTIDSCSFDRNKAARFGGGLYSAAPAGIANISRCQFSSDTAAEGGGIFYDGIVSFYNNRVLLNRADRGAGMYHVNSGTSILRNDTFSGNEAILHGAGLYNRNISSGCAIRNSLFSGNKAGGNGGAIYDSAASPGITNCTFAGDTASSGNGIYNNASSPAILNNIIWEGSGSGIVNVAGSAPVVTYSTVQGGYAGIGNLSADPLFWMPIPAAQAPTTTGIYELISCSPAVDAGNNTGSYAGVTDLAGNPRLYGSRVDQGAYEYSGAAFPQPILGDSALCVNNSIQLRNNITGGTWTSSNPLVATVSSSGIVTGVSVGTDTIIYSISRGSCSGTVRKIITVALPPVIAPITGRDTFCVGHYISMSNATPGGTWTSSNSSIGQISPGGQLSAINPGTVAITYTVSSSPGCTASVTKNMTFVARPPVPSFVNVKASICQHEADTFIATPAGGIWRTSYPMHVQIDTATGVIIGLAAGNASVSYAIFNPYCVSGITYNLTVVGLDTGVTNFGYMLASDEPGADYQWLDCSNGRSEIPGATFREFYPPANGTYAVVVRKSDCSDTSACTTISTINVTATNGPESLIKTYPNPTSGFLTITTGAIIPDYILLRDITGKVLQRLVPLGNTTSLNLSAYPSGLYQIEVYEGTERHTARISVIR